MDILVVSILFSEMTKQKPINQGYDAFPSGDEAILCGPEVIDLLEHDPQYQEIQKNMGKEIVENISREQYIFGLLEKHTKKYVDDPIRGIQEYIAHCREDNGYNTLFAEKTLMGEDIVENENLARELLNHCLGGRGRKQGFTQEQRHRCKTMLHELTKDDSTDLLTHLYTMMPASLQGASKVDMLAKVSILMLLLAQSHPEQFTHLDQFIEKQVFLDAMLQGKTFSETIEETLTFAQPLEMKNTGAVYNYRADDLFTLLYAAKDALAKVPEMLGKNKVTDAWKRRRAKKNDPVLTTFQEWYETIQEKLIALKKVREYTDEQVYVAYNILNQMYFIGDDQQGVMQNGVFAYFYDQHFSESTIDERIQSLLLFLLLPTYMADKKTLIAERKRTRAFETYLQEQMPEMFQTLLLRKRGEDAVNLDCVKDGKVRLRLDGKIDIPELGIVGMGELKSNDPTDEKNWTIVQGNFIDKHGKQGIVGKTYFKYKKAKDVVDSQGLKLFQGEDADEKIHAFLDILANYENDQAKNFHILFGKELVGEFVNMKWQDVSKEAPIGMSMVNLDGPTMTVLNSNTDQIYLTYGKYFIAIVFLACEEC